MPRGTREQGRVVSAWVMSIVGHLAGFGIAGLVVASSLGRHPAPVAPPVPSLEVVPVEVELPAMADGTSETSPALPEVTPQAPLPRGGGEGVPRPDMAALGRGGTDHAALPALNLADRDEQILLSPEIMSRLDRTQIQRLRTARDRASREDWRASRTPMELTFLAEGRAGVGSRREHRKPSDRDPSLGARDKSAPEQVGGVLGAASLPPDGDRPARVVGAAIEGGDRASPGIGVRDGAPGVDHRDSAKVPLARPMVAEGTPSIPSNRQGKPSDTVDSEQEVALAMKALVHASPAGGIAGTGMGGQSGPSPTGADGVRGVGSKSHALGTGAGAGVDSDPRDRRRSEYMRHVLAKVNPLWAFPKWAALEGLQGTAIVTFTVLSDGSVASPVVSRPSGIPEFDESCRRAVLRAAPFEPLPPELGQSLRWSMPFDVRNPAVKPKATKLAGRSPGDDG